jgi:molybdate transport system ATP-binding protein
MQLELDIRKTLRSANSTFELATRFASDSQRIVILGPSGSGKSLMLKAIAGLVTPDAGHIRLGGATLFERGAGVDVAPQQRQVGYLFQDYALFPHLNVRQNVGFGLARGWLNPRARASEAAVDYWLDAFALAPLARQYPHQLSGGQRQRTALARALVAQPRALLLDEPFAALDPALRIAMRAELDALQRRLNVPMVLITHDPEDARVLGEHVIHLRDGMVENSIMTSEAAP